MSPFQKPNHIKMLAKKWLICCCGHHNRYIKFVSWFYFTFHFVRLRLLLLRCIQYFPIHFHHLKIRHLHYCLLLQIQHSRLFKTSKIKFLAVCEWVILNCGSMLKLNCSKNIQIYNSIFIISIKNYKIRPPLLKTLKFYSEKWTHFLEGPQYQPQLPSVLFLLQFYRRHLKVSRSHLKVTTVIIIIHLWFITYKGCAQMQCNF